MVRHQIKTGDRIEIFISGEKEIVYLSQVENVIGKNLVIINMPISHGNLIKLKLGYELKAVFYTQRGMYKHTVIAKEHFSENGFMLTALEIIDEGEKFQRREYFRFETLVSIKFSLLEKSENDDSNVGKVFDGVTKDICGGGMKYITDANLNQDDVIKAIIFLNDEVVVTKCVIIDKQRIDKGVYKYQYRAYFPDLEMNEREKIIQYIFEQQRKSITKIK